MNKQFELLEFVFESIYVDVWYNEISLTFTTGSVCLCSPWSVCEVVVVPYVVGAVVVVSAYMGGTRGSGVLSSTGDVLEMSVVRGVGGVCDKCMCLARGGLGSVGGEWVTG